MSRSGAGAIVEALIEQGVEVVFGYPGGAVLGLYDEIAGLRHVLTRHEQAAAHAADGYARSTGRPGVCFATSGPGATNLVTGIATAFMDSVPLVAITGQVSTGAIGTDAFQEADITGITVPVTKYSFLVKDPSQVRKVISQAFHIATTGRPGPVLVDVPKDVQDAALPDGPGLPQDFDLAASLPGYKPTYTGHPLKVRAAADAIDRSHRPVIIAGGGVVRARAAEDLVRLARRCGIPVACTLMGLGAIPSDDPLAVGMIGMCGMPFSNRVLARADLVLAVGTRFSDRVTVAGVPSRSAPIVHVDIDPAEIGKNIRAAIPVVGDARVVLREIAKSTSVGAESRQAWLAEVAELKRGHSIALEARLSRVRAGARTDADGAAAPGPRDGYVSPLHVIRTIDVESSRHSRRIIATEVGQNQMWVAQYFGFKRPGELITSGGLGTMGYGLPAAIGAQVGNPGALVVDIAGDGSFQMNIQELGTIAQQGLPVKVAILNNGRLGMVRQAQDLSCYGRYSCVDLTPSPDFAAIAKAYGLEGRRVTRPEDVEEAVRWAFESPGCVVLDFAVDPFEDVEPMLGFAPRKVTSRGPGPARRIEANPALPATDTKDGDA